MGATQEQNPGYRAKVAFGDLLGHLAKAMQEYYADGNNALVDGLFTAAKIKLLVTPTSLRSVQHRPDLPMLVEQWRANSWNPEWEGAKLPREMHRLLLATFKKASEEFAEGKIAEMDGGEVEAGDVEMALAEEGMDAAVGAAAGAAGADLAMPAPTATVLAGTTRATRFDKDFAGWCLEVPRVFRLFPQGRSGIFHEKRLFRCLLLRSLKTSHSKPFSRLAYSKSRFGVLVLLPPAPLPVAFASGRSSGPVSL